MLRLFFIVSLTMLLQACGLADRFFTTNECEGDNCEAPVLLDNSNPEQKWFCYGKSQDEDWQCQNTEDQTQIVAVKPAPAATQAQRPLLRNTIEQAQIVASPPTPPTPVKLPQTNSTAELILNSPADQFAVQLVALKELSGIREYAGLNGIDEPLIVKTRSDNSDWYILLLGLYDNKALAEAAKNDWSTAKVLRVQPWIRKLGGLQTAIRAAQE